MSETRGMAQMEEERAWVPLVTVAERPYAMLEVVAQEVACEVPKIACETVTRHVCPKSG